MGTEAEAPGHICPPALALMTQLMRYWVRGEECGARPGKRSLLRLQSYLVEG